MQNTNKSREILEKSIDLKNGLTLKIWDKSRVIAGDRWKILVIAQIDVPLEKSFFETKDPIPLNFDEMKMLFGESVRFEKKMERFFIDEKEKDGIIQDLIKSLQENLIPYLSHPGFGRRFLISEFSKAKQKASWVKQS